MSQEGPRTLIEASWEVVNKVGGINTVVKTKAKYLTQKYENYLLVGPLFPGRRDIEFSEQPPPEHLRHIFEDLRQDGIHCVYGTWLIEGKPSVVLINTQEARFDTNHIKGLLWERFGVDTLHSAWDYDEPLRWAWATGMLVERLQHGSDRPVVLQAHEWLAGIAILYLKIKKSMTATVFTTHATMLGRTLSGATDISLYDKLQDINPLEQARRLGVMDKHTTEVACAKQSDVFTTVSEITSLEAQYLLGRKPDVLLYNGLSTFSAISTNQMIVMQQKSQEALRDFLDYYFFSHYQLDLDECLIFFTSGRYEYKNKGMDVLTEALARLNDHLKTTTNNKTVVVFYFVPGETHGIKTELLEERAAFSRMQEYVTKHSNHIIRKILRSATELTKINCEQLLDDKTQQELVQLSQMMHHAGNPPLCTHNIPHEENDPIVAGFRVHGMHNTENDQVKVIHYPIYLTGNDGLLDLPYEEVIAGTDLGIFPSVYEPWGYTPAETIALGVPAVTTDLAGFGRFILQQKQKGGVFVLQREHIAHDDIVTALYNFLRDYTALSKSERQEQKLLAKQCSQNTTWETFINFYYQAHQKAYENTQKH